MPAPVPGIVGAVAIIATDITGAGIVDITEADDVAVVLAVTVAADVDIAAAAAEL